MKLIKMLKKSRSSNNPIIKSILILSGGTASAQIINIIFTPIITRLYSPEDMGTLTLFMSILVMFSIMGSLKYELGIPLANNDKKAINIVALCISILVVFVGLITIFISFFGDTLLGLFSATALIKYQYFIPFGILFTGLYAILTQWAFRKKNYIKLSKTKFTQSIGQNFIKILMGIFSFGPIGLILGNIIGQSAGISLLASTFKGKDKHLIKKINKKTMYWCAKRYINFPKYTATSHLLNSAGLQLPVFITSYLYGSSVTGYYGLAAAMVNIPMQLIGLSIADVFYAEAASFGRNNPQKLKLLVNKILVKTILIGLLPFIILLLFGPFLFSFIFGDIWYEAGVYARIIALLVFARLVFTPISRVFTVYERQKEELALDVIRILLVIGVYVISKHFLLSSYLFILLYTIGMTLLYLLTYLWARNIINQEIIRK